MATKAADDANAAIAKLSGEVEPPAISRAGNLFAASRSDLERLGRDLKTAEANATTLMPHAAAVLKAERDDVEKFAASLRLGKDVSSRLLDYIDRRHAEIAALTSSRLTARADFYRAYQNCVAIFSSGNSGPIRSRAASSSSRSSAPWTATTSRPRR